MKSKSNIIGGTETGQDKLLGKIPARVSLGFSPPPFSLTLFLFLSDGNEARSIKFKCARRSKPISTAPASAPYARILPWILGLRPAVCGPRYWTSQTMRHAGSIIERYLFRVRKSRNRSAIERFIASSPTLLVLSINPVKHRRLLSRSPRKVYCEKKSRNSRREERIVCY